MNPPPPGESLCGAAPEQRPFLFYRPGHHQGMDPIGNPYGLWITVDPYRIHGSYGY